MEVQNDMDEAGSGSKHFGHFTFNISLPTIRIA